MDGQTDRQMDGQTVRQTDRQAGRQIDRQTNRQTDRSTDRLIDRQTDRGTDGQTEGQTNKLKKELIHNIQRGSHLSLSLVSFPSSILVELEFGDVGFYGGRKTREPGEKSLVQGENQQPTHPT